MNRKTWKENDHSAAGVICNATGMSKSDLARILGTNQNLLAKYSANERFLPHAPAMEILQLFTIVNRLPQPEVPAPTAEEKAELLEEAGWRRTECTLLEKQLHQMQLLYLQGARLKLLLKVYPANDNSNDSKIQRWIEGQHYEADKKMKINGWMTQQGLQTKIALLQYEAGLYEAAAGNL